MRQPAFILGTQYFRPPFPKPRYWEDDIKAMRDAGLNAVQLWMVWGWCEPEPGCFEFDDYDRIADIAARHEIGVVLSTLPEINPFWVPRVHPDALMVDIEGNTVLSCNRGECISGHVPGACSDHPDIRKRMIDFLTACGEHFTARDNLLAWDCWNENRWRNFAPEIVCFCEHSLASFRDLMRERDGDLDGLADAWGRKLCDWADVRPGRFMGNSYPEMHDFTNWMCRRAQDMARWRIDTLRAADPNHPVSSHTGNPTVFGGINLNENLFSRGIDWDIALGETYGFSSFPSAATGIMPPEVVRLRCSSVTTAGGGKPFWMSELQGGPTAQSRHFGPPVSGDEQQNWIWTGISRGAKAVVLWCWRPEVFGNESNGFGFTAHDGLADDRRQAMQQTAKIIDQHAAAVTGFEPDAPEVAVLFQRDSYFYDWLMPPRFNRPYEAAERFTAWPLALERLNVHFAVHDDRHLPEDTGALKLVIVPNAIGLDDEAAKWLADFAASGGTILVENTAGSYGPDTFFREPNGRPLYQAIGLEEDLHRALMCERRTIPAGAVGNAEPVELIFEESEASFKAGQGGVVALEPDGLPMLANVAVGKGRAICLGSIAGHQTGEQSPDALDAFMRGVLGLADVTPAVSLETSDGGFATVRLGTGGGKRLAMVLSYQRARTVTLRISNDALPANADVTDWLGHDLQVTRANGCTAVAIAMNDYDRAVLEWT